MKKITKIISLILYYGIAKHMPNYSFPGGKLFNAIRVITLGNIIPVGRKCRIMRKVYVGTGNNVIIGNHCRINENVRLDNVKIGDHVMIARDSVILGKSHESSDVEIPMEQQGNKEQNQSIIEDDVWIGLRVIVLPGLKIRKGCIIGAGAVVTKDTEEFGVYGGVPAKLIRKRNKGNS